MALQNSNLKLYPIFYEWFDIPVPEQEVTDPIQNEKLECLTSETKKAFSARLVHKVAQKISQKHLTAIRRVRAEQAPSIRTEPLQQALLDVLGPMTPITSYRV